MWPSGVWVVCKGLHDRLWVYEVMMMKKSGLPHPQQQARPIGPTNNDTNQKTTVNEVGPDDDALRRFPLEMNRTIRTFRPPHLICSVALVYGLNRQTLGAARFRRQQSTPYPIPDGP
jgi:hypothetical protein